WEARQCEGPRIRGRREGISRRTGVKRRVVYNLTIGRAQQVEPPILAAHTEDFRGTAVNGNRQDLRRVSDRLILVFPFLRVIASHGVRPDVTRVDLSYPSLLARLDIERDDRTGVPSAKPRIVVGRAPRRGIDVGSEEDRSELRIK